MPVASERCPRCAGSMGCSSGSYFTTQMICCTCKTEERQLPGYAHAEATESAEVQKGNYRFAGVGLSEEDTRAMQAIIAARKGRADT